ncbi:MAG: mercury methylation ferredoxin HgcB [Desulfobacteraceae bacterium]|nr:mercury methylation ferredoxin HgcB [Desulfobacteraceae bacterium]
MKDFRYIKNVTTLKLNRDACIGCGACETVCPHQVFEMAAKKAIITDKDACMECGACAMNCPTKAISVTPGVGCAAHIIQTWIKGSTGLSVRSSGGCC